MGGITGSATDITVHLDPRAQGQDGVHNPDLWRAVNRLGAAIEVIVAVSMGIGAALFGYPVWATPLIAILGAGGVIVALRVFR